MSIQLQISTPIPNEPGPLGDRRGRLCFEWVKARFDLALPLTTTVISEWQLGKTIDDARNDAAQRAIDNGSDFLFFLDWDVIPHPQTVHQLVQRALNSRESDVFSGVYCCRHRDYPAPLVYFGDDFKLGWDWTVGDVLTTKEHSVTGFGMGLALIRVSLLKRLEHVKRPWFSTSFDETEDLYFLKRCRQELSTEFLVDTGLLAWHIDPQTGIAANLPHESTPVKRWRKQCGAAKNQVPYDLGQISRACIGNQVTNCSEVPA